MDAEWGAERLGGDRHGASQGFGGDRSNQDPGGGAYNGQRTGAECYICHQVGHSLRDCPQSLSGGPSALAPALMQQDQPPRKRARFKSVTWASDDRLRQIRLFSAEDAPAMAGSNQQQANLKETKRQPMPDLPPGFGSQAGGTGRRIRTDSAAVAAVLAQVTWRSPQPVELNPEWQVVAGGSSMEVAIQQEREKRSLEAIYPRMLAVPESPHEPLEPQEEYDDSLTHVIPMVAVEDEEMAERGSEGFCGPDSLHSSDSGNGRAANPPHYEMPPPQTSAGPGRDWDTSGTAQQLQSQPPPASWQANMQTESSPPTSNADEASQALGPSGQLGPPLRPAQALSSSSPQGAAPSQVGPSPGPPQPAGPPPHASTSGAPPRPLHPPPTSPMAIVAPLLNSAALAAGGADVTAATAAAIATMSDSGLIDRELLVKILSDPNMIARALAMQGQGSTGVGAPAVTSGPPLASPGSAPAGPPGGAAPNPAAAPPGGGPPHSAPPHNAGPVGPLPGGVPPLGGGFSGGVTPAGGLSGPGAPVSGPFASGPPSGPSFSGPGHPGSVPSNSRGLAPGPLPPQYPAQEKGIREAVGAAPGTQLPPQLAVSGEPRRDSLPSYSAQEQAGQSQGSFPSGQDVGAGPSLGFNLGRQSHGQAPPQLGPPQSSGGYPSQYTEPRGREQGMLPPEGPGYPRPPQYPPKPGQAQYGDGNSRGEYDGASIGGSSGLATRGDSRPPPISMGDKLPPFDLQLGRRDTPMPRGQEDGQNGYLPSPWVGAPPMGRGGKPGASPRSPWDSPRDSEGSPGGVYQKSEYDRLSERHGSIAGRQGGRGRGRGGRVCAYFNTARGCRNGPTCPFVHEGPPGGEGGMGGGPSWGRGRGRGDSLERDRGIKRPPAPLEEGELVG